MYITSKKVCWHEKSIDTKKLSDIFKQTDNFVRVLLNKR